MAEVTEQIQQAVALEVEVVVPQCHLLLALMEMLEGLLQLKDFKVEILPRTQVEVVVVEVAQHLLPIKDKT
jgi:hypothetical protein